jgi:hypothetical protein
MVTRAQMDRLKQAADERRAVRDAMPDVAAFGQLVRKDAWTKTFRRVDEDGQPVGTLVMRGGTALQVVGLDLACVTGDCDHDHDHDHAPTAPAAAPEQPAPADEQPQTAPAAQRPPAAAEHPQPAGNHPSGTAPQLDPNLAAIAAARWSKDPSGKGTAL